jgi:SHS2 domain-containing protein
VTYEWVDHTGEMELRIAADSEAGVFAEALAAYRELGGGEGEEEAVAEIGLNGVDRADLLAQWLDELVYLADTRGFIPERILDVEVWPDALRATVAGRVGSPSPLVKAVTYHGLGFTFDGTRWHAQVVLDV